MRVIVILSLCLTLLALPAIATAAQKKTKKASPNTNGSAPGKATGKGTGNAAKDGTEMSTNSATSKTSKPDPASPTLLDVVKIRNGPRLAGIVIRQTRQGELTIVVEREWLATSVPDYFRKKLLESEAEAERALTELEPLMTEWKRERVKRPKLARFIDDEIAWLKDERKQVESKQAGNRRAPQFLLIDLKPSEIEHAKPTTPESRQLALVAWREQLPDVATRTSTSLQRELLDAGIQPTAEQVNLSDRLPFRQQSSTEWRARRAVLEYSHDEPLDFQGTPELLIPVVEGKQQDALPSLLMQVIQSQVNSLVGDLLNEGGPGTKKATGPSAAALTKAQHEADKKGLCGFRATILTLDVERQRATVDTRFYAKIDQAWKLVWSYKETQQPAAEDRDRILQIRNDPQVKQGLELLQSSGLTSGQTLDTALAVGAATMRAQDSCNRQFHSFLGHYRHKTIGPPLYMAESEN